MKKSQYRKKLKNEENIIIIDDIRYYKDQTTGELIEILTDKSSTGRIRPWAEHKKSNLKLADIYYNIYQRTKNTYWLKRKDRLASCGNTLTFNLFDIGESKPVIKVKNIQSCKVRLCPMCNWRRSLKLTAQMQEILQIVSKTNDFSYLMLTLTVPNVAPSELSDAITDMLKAWNLLAKYKAFGKAIKGWYRGLEVTYNTKTNTYHPHIHCILAVNKSYFKSRDYIKQADWLIMWQQACKNPAITQIDIRKIKSKNNSNDIMSAVVETCKYTVKSSDYIKSDVKLSADIVEVLDKSLANRRLVAFGGCFKIAQAQAKNKGIDGDLVNIDEEKCSEGVLLAEICYCFRVGFQQYIKL